jgi:hypothetical protein
MGDGRVRRRGIEPAMSRARRRCQLSVRHD